MSTKMLLHKFMGTAAAGGYANFFTPGTSVPKSTYTSTTYATAEEIDVPISSDGWIKTYLLGDYDMDVFSSNGTQIPSASADGINPQAAAVANDPNLAPNGSFETDSNDDGTPDNWVLTSFSGATNARVSSDQRHGAHAMSFTSTGSGGGHITSEDFIPVNADGTLTLAFSLISSVADVRNVVDILWFDEDQASLSTTSVYDEDTSNPTSWTRYTFHVTPVSTAKYAKLRLYGCHSSDSTPGTARYDDVQLLSFSSVVSKVATHNEAYTLELSDAGKTLLKTAADTTTRIWTIPLNATVPFPIGTRIWGENQDDNALTITATGAATLINLNGNAPSDGDVTISQGQAFELYQYAADAWAVISNLTTNGPLGTPSSGTLTNCTGLPQAGTVGLTTADSPQFAGINLGHESDTTLIRPAAGRLQVEGVEVARIVADQSIELGGDFSTNTARLLATKTTSGTKVELFLPNITHTSNSVPSSNDNVIPSQYRPITTQANNVYAMTAALVKVMAVTTSGRLNLAYRGWDGIASAGTNTDQGSISWYIAD